MLMLTSVGKFSILLSTSNDRWGTLPHLVNSMQAGVSTETSGKRLKDDKHPVRTHDPVC